MGIQGLLPALKSIQTTKHLSEFSGQIIAVDAYVWLHKGVFTCATELATGKITHKYVNYAMEKVRLLRYHGIEPYIVFDGGPLPAKKGTEVERKRKRDEYHARGNLLASQGKHAQARECYIKCVDVTPQMAFQFIKALRAESVKYVVAPYEADAQLAYLERTGAVSGILTEDSDLLVFGCKNILLKFDAVARTVVHISRADFASVTADSSNSTGVSLVGWSDTQFRAMAILSGCDYLPSIPGIGLKTACMMLRKWKTPQAVVRQVALEGKKRVPKGYMVDFKRAESCFLHQRIYDPLSGKLVHLTDVDRETWDEVLDAYVGGDLDPTLAKKLAMGDVDPVTFEPMEDINPGFTPRSRVLRDLPNCMPSISPKSNGKAKAEARKAPSSGGILSFFGPNPTIPPRPKSPPLKPKMVVGKASGKRTLAEVMELDMAAKKKRKNPSSAPTSPNLTASKFFGPGVVSNVRRASLDVQSGSGVSHSQSRSDKENSGGAEGEEDADDADSLLARGHVDSDWGDDMRSEDDAVEQEDGYVSPTPSRSNEADDLSSPLRPGSVLRRRSAAEIDSDGFDFEVDPISSPLFTNFRTRPHQPPSHFITPIRAEISPKVLVEASPEVPSSSRKFALHPKGSAGKLDLRNSFGDELTSEIDCSDDELESCAPSPSPLTPEEAHEQGRDRILSTEVVDPLLEIEDLEEQELIASASRNKAVAAGWRKQWALGPSRLALGAVGQRASAPFKRRETNVTPAGRHRLPRTANLFVHPYQITQTSTPDFVPSKSAARSALQSVAKPVEGRKSLTFFPENRGGHAEATPVGATATLDPLPEQPEALARLRFERFRCP